MNKTILVSNDDGIYSEGLLALAESLKSLGEVVIVAPDRDQSAVSHSLSLFRPLRLQKHDDNKYSVDGTPTDCINLAVNGILKDKKPDLIVSGINMSANLGEDVTYSGTVSAAMEGTLLNIPSIAVSLDGKKDFLFETAAHYSEVISKFVLENGIPAGTLLNVNIPNIKIDEVAGIKVTRQGKRIYEEPIVEKIDPRGKKYFWIGGFELGHVDIRNSDIVCLRHNFVSVTPIKLDLTHYDYMDELKEDLKNNV